MPTCCCTFADSLTELFGTGDIDIVHNALGLLNRIGDIKLTRWTLNPKWHVHYNGLRVNVQATIECGRQMTQLKLDVHLHRDSTPASAQAFTSRNTPVVINC